MRTFGYRVVMVFAFLTAASGASAQLLADSPDRVLVSPRSVPDFGTASTSILTISSHSFQLAVGTELIDSSKSLRLCLTEGCQYFAGVSLPSGAFVTGLEIEGCDGDPLVQVGFFLGAHPPPAQPYTVISPVGVTGGVDTPGCALFPVAVGHTIDNLTGHYVVYVSTAYGINVGFAAARIRYNLQVSTPPLTATFNDVPTGHPQFQFIEALVAAGITAGCGAGNYCPDASLTRGQMAVFLSKALGLHFPN